MPKDDERKPIDVTREELYRQVWETPMTKLAATYGLSGNGIAKICDRLNVPYPPRGYWAKLAAGKKMAAYKLPKQTDDIPDSVTITPTPPLPKPPEPPELPEAVQQQVDVLQASAAGIVVPDRLSRPHKVIAGWIAKFEQDKREAQMQRDPERRRLFIPTPLTDRDRRRYRILDTLFKQLERQGGVVTEND